MLNFDPHHWLAERSPAMHQQTLAGLATLAGLNGENKKSELAKPAAKVANLAKEPAANPSITLREWHSHLAPLDCDAAPQGFTLPRWRELRADSWWIYENFAGQAVRDGWSAPDLFGVLVSRPGWGGLCDRLQGARNLKMAGPKAVWSSWCVPDWTCVGAGDSLLSSGLKLIWELPMRPIPHSPPLS